MAVDPLYPADEFRFTRLSEPIDAAQTTIPVQDASQVPEAPNIITILTTNPFADPRFETILYTGKSGDTLTGCVRGFQGTAQPWGVGAYLTRTLTAYDLNTIIGHLNDLHLKSGILQSALQNKADLDANGNVIASQLPSLVVTDVHVVASDSEQFALTVEKGDICVRTDLEKTFIAINSENKSLADWVEMLSPRADVLSVNGKVGTVVLSYSDVGAAPTTHSHSGGDVTSPVANATVAATCTGNAATATRLQTARTITLSGDVTGSVQFDGSANVTLLAIVADDSHNHVIGNVDGLQDALDGKAVVGHNHDDLYEPAFVKRTAFNKDFGTTKGTVCEGNDSRLSDARTPKAHTHTTDDIPGLQATIDGKSDTGHIHGISDITNLQATLNGKSATNHTHNSLIALDDRDRKPSDVTKSSVEAVFTTLGGMTGTADNDYQDMLVLNTWCDSSGGKKNALVLDKSEMVIRHYQAAFDATTWGTPKILAYTDSNISGNAASATKLGGYSPATTGTANTIAQRDGYGDIYARKYGATSYRLVPGSSVCYENNAAVTRTSVNYTVAKTAPAVPSGRAGLVRVHYAISRPGSGKIYARLTKNGIAIPGSEIVGDVANNISHTIDIEVTSGDVISLEVKNGTSGQSVVSGVFRINAELVPVVVAGNAW